VKPLSALTIVAIGTSLPELVTSVMAAWRKSGAVAIGNVVGSNIFNIGLILGGTAVILPLDVDQRIIIDRYVGDAGCQPAGRRDWRIGTFPSKSWAGRLCLPPSRPISYPCSEGSRLTAAMPRDASSMPNSPATYARHSEIHRHPPSRPDQPPMTASTGAPRAESERPWPSISPVHGYRVASSCKFAAVNEAEAVAATIRSNGGVAEAVIADL
jgi:hypothetical protein